MKITHLEEMTNTLDFSNITAKKLEPITFEQLLRAQVELLVRACESRLCPHCSRDVYESFAPRIAEVICKERIKKGEQIHG